jgi:uncharacterized protein YbjT (DUF2867 family)
MTALIIGATGLVGGQCLRLLLTDPKFDRVTALVRRPMGIDHPKLHEVIVDFERLDSYAAEIKGDVVFSALGTTIRKAGSSAKFTKVDYEYQLKVAEIARRNGATTFILVSSLGANARSLMLYSRIKGEVEDAISKLGYDKFVVLRPSILLGERGEKRPGEEAGQWIAKKLPFLFAGPLTKYKGIPIDVVVHAMNNAVQKPYKGVRIVENLEIFDWAKA